MDWPLFNGDIPYQMLSSWLAQHWLPEKEQGEMIPTLQFRKGRKALEGIRYKTKRNSDISSKYNLFFLWTQQSGRGRPGIHQSVLGILELQH